MRFLRHGLWVGFTLLVAGAVLAAPQFPSLTGRVVDQAHTLPPAATQTLTQNLAAFEQKTGHQLVVVTVSSLQGVEIEDYGYQLGRHWGIGHRGKDDGVLLIVAPNERRVRIEVGYGLEGTLTDALSNQIIQTVILPEFKRGDMPTGIVNGARAIIGVLGGMPYALPAKTAAQQQDIPLWAAFLFVAFIIFIRWRFGVLLIPIGGLRGGRGSGGGFGGGGGSFGGGGSSGKW